MFNYSDLNDVEFEELCKDVMEKKLNKSLRTFSKGKDKGVDIRNDDNSIIIQVKHYIKSTYSTLKSNLIKELTKVDNLKPKEYYICVSQELNPMQIDEIYKIFEKYMKNTSNIITIKEIDYFLQKTENEDIVNKHFKLWLSSSKVLEKIGKNDILIDCETLLDAIENETKYFVKTNMYNKCLEILEGERIIVITGMPGVGKTITSKMLVLKYVEQGYKVRYTTNNDVSNLKKSISSNPELKEIILLDDCLGQHYLKMGEQKENEIISLIKYVKLHTNKVLVMNSRITILNEAKKKSEEFNNIIEDKDIRVYTINMDNISLIEKAKILYNHIYFNNIGEEYFEEIKKDRRYFNIVRHRNYNPRIIQNITKRANKDIPVQEYYQYIIKCLNNPEFIWKNEYEHRIEKEDRILLLTLYSISDSMVKYEILERAFNKRIEQEKDIDTSKNCFIEVIKRLNESMIKVTISGKQRYISVLNPSVNDFLKEEFYSNEIARRRILENVITIEQIKRIYRYREDDINKEIEDQIKKGTILNLINLNEKETIHTTIISYIVYFEIKDKKWMDLIEKGLEDYEYDTYYRIDSKTTYRKKDVIFKLLNGSLYTYYNIIKKLEDVKFVENLISNIEIEDLIDVVNLICNKFVEESKNIPENILYCIQEEINYELEQFFNNYELSELNINLNEIFYKEREKLEDNIGYDLYQISEEEFDKELIDRVKEEIEEISNYEFQAILGDFCEMLPNQISDNIRTNFNKPSNDAISNLIKQFMEPAREYDIDEILDEDTDIIEIEIDNMFNRKVFNEN